MTRKYHTDGNLPEWREIFVFGSNLAGIHGAGAARVAREQFGALDGAGQGLVGRSYAIATKDANIRQALDLSLIGLQVQGFLYTAEALVELQFFVTAIGCGLAGYDHAQIAPMFESAPDNCSFPDLWEPYLGS